MAITIAAESPLQDDVRAMIAELNALLRPLSPPQFQFQMTAEQMAGDETTVFVARDGHSAVVGMGSLKTHDAKLGEIKRMFTAPCVRGTGVGRLILGAIEDRARGTRLERLVLETGSTRGFEPAWRIYERAGYTQCGAVLDYPDSAYNRFYEKKL